MPAISFAELSAGATVRDRIRHLLVPDSIPGRTPLVLLWRGEQLSTPDTVTATASSEGEWPLELEVQLRRFDGALHVNTFTVPIVEVELGALEPGRYDVRVTVAERWFREYGHPEDASNLSVRRSESSFVVG